jgi:uncharacterized membrane protein (DUF485 family)
MHRTSAPEDDKLALGMALTALQVLSYLSFVAACCFAPAFIEGRTLSNGVPWSFAMGLAVIALGVVLTIAYVTATNRAEHAA